MNSKIRKSSYKEYFGKNIRREIVLIVKALGVMIILDYFFYKSNRAFIFLAVPGIGFYMLEKRNLFDTLRYEFREQFKEFLLLSATNQKAGYSGPNSFVNCYADMATLFGSDCAMCNLIKKLENSNKNKQSISDIFIQAGMKCKVEELIEFGQIYEIAYQRSGNLSEVMEKTAHTIIDKMDTENEIFVSLGQRRFEMRIMDVMPFLIMFYIDATGGGYFDGMYHTVYGVIIMSVCLLLYILAYLWGERLIRIQV